MPPIWTSEKLQCPFFISSQAPYQLQMTGPLLFDNKIYSKCIDYDLTSFCSTTYIIIRDFQSYRPMSKRPQKESQIGHTSHNILCVTSL